MRIASTQIYRLMLVVALALFAVSCGDDDPVSTVQQPSITGMTPTQAFLGEQVDGRITGSNLSGATSVNLGDGITVTSVQSLSSGEIQVAFTVSRNTTAGARSVSVTTAGGTATAAGLLEVRNNTVPVVDFKISGGTKSKNQIVTFDASGSTDALIPATIASYGWDFGDGTTGNGKIVEHKYLRAGVLTVTLTVTDNQGGKGKASKGITIQDNFAPTAKFTAPKDVTAGKEASFDGSASTDPDGKIVKYSWNFGDGKKGEGKTAKHTYATDDTFAVTLTVTDDSDATGAQEREVKVKPGEGGGGGTGGNEGTCTQNDFRTNRATVVDVQGNVVTMNRAFRKCPGCGEFRRRADGLREFVGDIIRFDGFKYTLNYGSLGPNTRPQVGETLYLVWKPSHECKRR